MLAIAASDLSFTYPDGTQAVNKISFKVQEREKVAVIGPNGSGKSPLLTLFNGIRRGDGILKIFNILLNKKNMITVKGLVGLVFQNPDDQLFCPTIFEDIAFGPLNLGLASSEVLDCVKQALNEVGLEGFEERSSFHLSYGERKLASLATVLAMNPRLIVLDEPTSNLDLAHRRKIIRWIQSNQKTMVLTSHDLDMILETCSRVILLNEGKIMADGNANEILFDKTLLEKNNLELPLSIQTKNLRS
jgi:cobalt/nickel transport system ATP-binding protein